MLQTERKSLLGSSMTHEEERYVHFVSSIDNLNSAWRILQEIRQHKDSPLVGPAFQFALIEYSKPYRLSRGTVGKRVEYKLDERHIPVSYRALHKRIVDARDQIHAHADLTVREATLHVANIASGKYATIVQNNIYGTEELSNLDSIIDLIEQTLDSMYIEVDLLKAALPLNL